MSYFDFTYKTICSICLVCCLVHLAFSLFVIIFIDLHKIAGATAPGIDLRAAAASHLLDVTAAIAVPLRSAVLIGIPLVPMGRP